MSMSPSPPRGLRGGGTSARRSYSPQRGLATHTLERDGVVPGLYASMVRMHQHAIRTAPGSDVESEAARKAHPGLTVPLPVVDTVVYERNFPQGWFAYDPRMQSIDRLPGKFLDAERIVEAFAAEATSCGGICAQFVECGVAHHSVSNPGASDSTVVGSSSPNAFGSFVSLGSATNNARGPDPRWGSEPTVASRARDLGKRSENTETLSVLYLDADMLTDLVFSRGQFEGFTKDGLLQRFVPPRSFANDLIQVVWSPRATTVRRAVNVHTLTARTMDPRQRAATFDGPAYCSRDAPVNALLQTKLLRVTESLASSLLVCEHKVLCRAVLFCKQDAKGDLWLLFASSIRVSHVGHTAAVKQPRLPLAIPGGNNFTSDVRDEGGIDEQQLEAKVNDMPSIEELRPKTSADTSSLVVYRRPSRSAYMERRFGFRVLSDVARDPQIGGPHLYSCASLQRAATWVDAPSDDAKPDPRVVSFIVNLAYELHEARTMPGHLVADSTAAQRAPPRVTIPRAVFESLSEAQRVEVFEQILALDATDAEATYVDGIAHESLAARSEAAGRSWKDSMIRSAAVKRAQRVADPITTTLRRLRAVLGSASM